MDNTSSEEMLDDKQWGNACRCAEVRIRSDIARLYGFSLTFEDFFFHLEEGIPDDVLAQALKHIKQSFDAEA